MPQKGKTLQLHGWLYRVETGKIVVLIDGKTGRESSVMRRFKKLVERQRLLKANNINSVPVATEMTNEKGARIGKQYEPQPLITASWGVSKYLETSFNRFVMNF